MYWISRKSSVNRILKHEMKNTKGSYKWRRRIFNIHRLSVLLLNARGIARPLNNDIRLLEDWIMGNCMNSLHLYLNWIIRLSQCLPEWYNATHNTNDRVRNGCPNITTLRQDWCILQRHMSNRFTRATQTVRQTIDYH